MLPDAMLKWWTPTFIARMPHAPTANRIVLERLHAVARTAQQLPVCLCHMSASAYAAYTFYLTAYKLC